MHCFKKSLLVLFLSLGTLVWAKRTVSMPEFTGVDQWLNTPSALTKEQLAGKVVLVDFWTYSCINCIRSIPYLKKWHEKYKHKGLVIIGVHTPEFHFEKKTENVQAAIQKFEITYPVALDNNYKTWDAYGSRTWPSDFLIDRSGMLVYSHFGEANFNEIESHIQRLLQEKTTEAPLVLADTPDFTKIQTPEIFFGYNRLSKIANRERLIPNNPHQFKRPVKLPKHHFALEGSWFLDKEFVELKSGQGRVHVRFQAGRLNMVMESATGSPIKATILLDGKPLTNKTSGRDVEIENGQGVVSFQVPRMYWLTQDAYREHQVEIIFETPGVRLYTITFG